MDAKQGSIPGGDRTRGLRIRSPTRFPLRYRDGQALVSVLRGFNVLYCSRFVYFKVDLLKVSNVEGKYVTTDDNQSTRLLGRELLRVPAPH